MTFEELSRMQQMVGVVCSEWAYLEYRMAGAIWWLLKLDEDTGQIVTGGLDIEGRAVMAVRLAKHLKANPVYTAALEACLASIQELSGERNLVVHGLHNFYHDTGKMTAEVHRGKFRGAEQPMTPIRVTSLSDQIEATIGKFNATLRALGLVQPLPPDEQAWIEKFGPQFP